ncbi:MAG: rod shape-determining protein MreD [Deltaproteobacteria bacterium]|nr:rod shape-determining protein MreD [Deltaproteobacteria bacterium]
MRAQLSWWGALAFGLLAQTTLLSHVLPDSWRPDITLILVLWVALTGTPRGGAALAFAAGLALDAMSGAPLGFNAVLRVLLYGLSRPFRGVFFDDRPILLLPFAALATAADDLGAWVMSWLFLPSPFPLRPFLGIVWRQTLVEAAAVPAVFLLMEAVSGRRLAKTLSRSAGEVEA